MSKLVSVLTSNWEKSDSFTISGYQRDGGYKALEKALKMKPDEVIQLVKD